MPFVELLAKSCFSFLEGASQPAELIVRAHELGLSALGLVDRDGLYGTARAFRACRELAKAGQTPPRLLVGAELRLEGERGARLALLVQDRRGYSNLCRLLTRAHEGRPKGEAALTLEMLGALEGQAEGLLALLPAPQSERVTAFVHDLFGDRASLVVHRHLVPEDRGRERQARLLARRHGLGIVASGRPLYHEPERRRVADVLACIRLRTTLDEAGQRLAPNAEAYLRSDAQMRRLFRDQPGWVDASGELAARTSFGMEELGYSFPCATEMAGEGPDALLSRKVRERLPGRYPLGTPPQVAAQIDRELSLVAQLQVAPYFLSVLEIVEIARARGILCQGRGSAANSAVCYALGITAVDPVRSNLLFERFLSAARSEPPDIDIDFEHERREEVIQAIYERYGRDRAAMVSEVISYRTKSALREVGKAFGLSAELVDRFSDAAHGGGELGDERLREVGLDPANRRVQQVMEVARAMQGFPRHLSIHSGGFILSAGPLTDVAPIEPARMQGRTVVPWDKDDLDTLGFFKVDVLGLGMLTAVRKGLELIRLHARAFSASPSEDSSVAETARGAPRCCPGGAEPAGAPFDAIAALAAIPSEDPAVYDAFCVADTVGVFQIESRAQMAMLPTLQPRRFYDLVIEVAIVRPGPIQGGMVHPFLRRRTGEEPVVFPHECLVPILERTLGVPLFQEQVMQIAIVGAGYSSTEADELRRDMAAWKKTGRLERHRQKLLDGFTERGISHDFADALYRQVQGFGEYGFPESHAASFALLVYASGWLKVRYPGAFTCALLNSQPLGFYTPSSLVQDAARHGVEVRDLSVVQSDWDCTLEWKGSHSAPVLGAPQPALRLGMRLLKGLREAEATRIASARRARPFDDIDDLRRRTGLARRDLELLAGSGALEPLTAGRRRALWETRAPRVGGLFEHLATEEPAPSLPPVTAAEQLVLDYEHKGLSVSDHPMRHLRRDLALLRGVLRSVDLAYAAHKSPVSVAGLVQSRQRPMTARGVVFVTLEDETGTCNVILWASVFERYRMIAVHAPVVLVRGLLERKGGVVHVVAESLARVERPSLPAFAESRDFH